ncbi:MAG: hypothetical protein ACK2UB_12395 [Anaerolineales bacterium]
MNAFRKSHILRFVVFLAAALFAASCLAASPPDSAATSSSAASMDAARTPDTPTPTDTLTPTRTLPPSATPSATATPSPFVPYLSPVLPQFAVARLGKGALNDAAVSPSGERLAVATHIGVYMYHLTDDGALLELWFLPTTIRMTAVAFSPDGKTLACGSYNGMLWASGDEPAETVVMLLDAASGDTLDIFPIGEPGTEVTSLVFSPEGDRLAAGFEVFQAEAGMTDLGVAFINRGTGEVSVVSFLYMFPYEEREVNRVESVAFARDGSLLAVGLEFRTSSGDMDGEILLLPSSPGEGYQTLAGHAAGVQSVAFSPDGTTLASLDRQGSIILWDAVEWEKVRTLSTGAAAKKNPGAYCQRGNSSRLAFSPDGKILAAGTADGRVHEWNIATGSKIRTRSFQSSGILALSFSEDGEGLISVSFDRSAVRYRTSGAAVAQAYSLAGHAQLSSVAFSPDGKSLLASDECADSSLWDIAAQEVVRTFDPGPAAFSPDGTILATTGAGNTIILWDTTSWSQKKVLYGHTDSIYAIAFSPDGKTLASGGADQSLILWDAATGGKRWKISGVEAYVAEIAFSPDGLTLAHTAGSSPSQVIFRDPATGEVQGTLEDEFFGIYTLRYSPDGRYFAVVSFFSMITVYDLPGYAHSGSPGGGTAIAFSPDGTILASGSPGDQYFIVCLSDLSAKNEYADLAGHNGLVIGVDFSPDGKILASASNDGTILLWEMAAVLDR